MQEQLKTLSATQCLAFFKTHKGYIDYLPKKATLCYHTGEAYAAIQDKVIEGMLQRNILKPITVPQITEPPDTHRGYYKINPEFLYRGYYEGAWPYVTKAAHVKLVNK